MDRAERAEAMWKRYERGSSMAEIATDFGLSEARVGQILKASGYPLERGGPQVRARRRVREMYVLYQQGLSLAEVGKHFGISAVSVGDAFQKYGLPARLPGSRQRSRFEDKLEEMHRMYRSGATLAVVATRYGISRSRLSELFAANELPTRSTRSGATAKAAAPESTGPRPSE